MSPNGHDDWVDTAASYLLGALPDEEVEAFELHLASCAVCREQVDELLPAVQALPVSVEPVAPPPALKARIMAEVEREASLLAAAGPEADRPPAPARRRRRLRLPALAMPRLALVGAAAALLLGVVAGVAADRALRDNGRTVVASVAQPAAGMRAEVDLSDGNATLVASGMHAPPSGRVYQVWLKRPGRAPEPTSALFTPSRDGSATATVPGPLTGVQQMLVTDEPLGGSRVPTGQVMLSARLSS
ncbi:MAG: hypothetical protein QOE28_589 [Solirubrobacteraceae bacterium]|nr:hypothetical protein [Solirubrobacteraceae bacterium]